MDKLKESQEHWILSCEESLSFWKKGKEDLIRIENRLSTLGDVLSHDITVPLCSVAFVPGQLDRTNEIFAFLGDGYFVQRSTKQACEIARRRIKRIEAKIEGFEKDLKRREDWQVKVGEMVKEKEEFTEVQEFISEEEYQKSKEERKKRMQEAREKLNLVSESVPKKLQTEEDILQRLEELELQEEAEDFLLLNDEIVEGSESESDAESTLSSVPEEEPSVGEGQSNITPSQVLTVSSSGLEKSGKAERKSVSWNSDLEEIKIIPEAVCIFEPQIVTFNATTDKVQSSDEGEDRPSTPDNGNVSSQEISSPGDFYKMFVRSPKTILKDTKCELGQSPEKKSILKGDSARNAALNEEISQLAEEILADRPPENTGVKALVMERDSGSSSKSRAEGSSRPVSKFRQARVSK